MIDILLSAYNAEKTIKRAVDSILQQTYEEFSLYVFNDASTDSTGQILKSIKDDRLIVINSNKNIGTYASKNFMLKNYCKNNFIALHDADDTSEPERLERQKKYLIENSDICCLGTSVNEIIVDSESHTVSENLFYKNKRKNTYPSILRKENLKDIQNLDNDKIYEKYLKFKFCKNGSVVIKKSVLEALGGWDGSTHIAADTDLFIRILGIGNIHNLSLPLYNRYFHSDSLTSSKQYGIDSEIRKKYNLGRKEVIKHTLESSPIVRKMYYPEIEVCVE
jgi:glycosyltransferase involved in cell wall biosynthesis